MKAFFVLVAVFATVSSTEAVRCRRCNGATSLDDCTYSILCPQGEVCYMDKVLTEQLTLEYNGGCRPRDVCSRGGGPGLGKRAGNLVICSGCCDGDDRSECNTKTCGITSSMAHRSNQCYHCTDGVDDPRACATLTSCQSDEICGAETFTLGGHRTYQYRCLPARLCALLTTESLKRLDECRQNPTMCPGLPGRKRETSGYKTCTSCCGDSLCNTGTCEELLEHLYNMWKAGVLDLHTLKFNGTAPHG